MKQHPIVQRPVIHKKEQYLPHRKGQRNSSPPDANTLEDVNAPGSAHLTAFLRAVESERPDALFHDAYARLLAGPEGESYAQAEVRQGAWGIAVRTHIYDELIAKTIEEGKVDVVLNLAAGFDTRPYRLVLPKVLRWIEVDLPTIIARKNTLLAKEQPVCELERVSLDLDDRAARKALLHRVSKGRNCVLVITEGLVGYLQPIKVAELAADLYAESPIHWWLTELPPAYILQGRASVIMKFAPTEGMRFFQQLDWDVAAFRSFIRESHRLKRTMPLAWLVRVLTWVSFLASSDRGSHSYDGGFLLLKKNEQPAPVTRKARKKQAKRGKDER